MILGEEFFIQKQAFWGNQPFVQKQALNKVKTRFWGTSLFRNRLWGKNKFLLETSCFRKKLCSETSFWGTSFLQKTSQKQAFGEEPLFLKKQACWGIIFFRNLFFETSFWGNMPLGKKPFQKQTFGGNKPFVEKQALNKVKTRFWGTSFFFRNRFLGETKTFVRNKLLQKRNIVQKQVFGEQTFLQQNKLETSFWGRTFVIEKKKQAFGGTNFLGNKFFQEHF